MPHWTLLSAAATELGPPLEVKVWQQIFLVNIKHIKMKIQILETPVSLFVWAYKRNSHTRVYRLVAKSVFEATCRKVTSNNHFGFADKHSGLSGGEPVSQVVGRNTSYGVSMSGKHQHILCQRAAARRRFAKFDCFAVSTALNKWPARSRPQLRS